MNYPTWTKDLPIDLLEKFAVGWKLDPALVIAIAYQESKGRTWATRFEPEAYARGSYFYFPREHASQLGITEQTERVGQYHSYGLLQIMGFSAREMGFPGYLTQLCDPEIGILYGCKKLKSLQVRYDTEADVISAYNQGNNRKTSGGMFINQGYVSFVNQYLLELRKLID